MKGPAFTALLLLGACAPAQSPDNGTNGTNIVGPPQGPMIEGETQPVDGQAPAEGTEDIAFTASPASVAQGGTLTLSLTNGTQQQLGYNLCTSAIVTDAGAAIQTDRVCTMELRTLEPSRSATYAYELPGDLAPGSYRMNTTVTRMQVGTQATVSTPSFEVTAR